MALPAIEMTKSITKDVRMRKGILCLIMLLMGSSVAAQTASGNAGGITRADIIYSIMVDRFDNGDTANDGNSRPKDPAWYHGGDLQGIINRLDYLHDLGVTALWLSPIMANDTGSYHGYKAVDYYAVNPYFGDLALFKKLVQEAHRRGIKIMLDLALNHTGPSHPWISDPAKKYWYHHGGSESSGDPVTTRLSGLPDLAQEHPEVKKYLIDMSLWWIRETGIDGYRLDAAKHVSLEFWEELSRAIHKEFPAFYTIGEAFDFNAMTVSLYQDAGLTGMLDFPLYSALNGYFSGDQDAEDFAGKIEEAHNAYSTPSLFGTFIDSHDVNRFISSHHRYTEEDLKAALIFQFTYTGIPVLYYGTEVAMPGKGDPDNRRDMDWKKESPVRNHVKALARLRRQHPALTSGEFAVAAAEGSLFAYSRSDAGSYFLVAMNNSFDADAEALVKLPAAAQKTGWLVDALGGSDYFRVGDDAVRIVLKPRQAIVLTPGTVPFLRRFALPIGIALGLGAVVGGLVIWRKRRFAK